MTIRRTRRTNEGASWPSRLDTRLRPSSSVRGISSSSLYWPNRSGLDSVVVSDHFLPWRHNGGHAPFALTWMAAVGERTERVQIGTSVLTPTFRYNPAVIAQAFATMALLYADRIMLGVGTGEALNEHAVSGAAWPEFKERFARLREAVRLMRLLWTQDSVDFRG